MSRQATPDIIAKVMESTEPLKKQVENKEERQESSTKIKRTFRISEDILSRMEEMWFYLKKHKNSGITKEVIMEESLKLIIADFEKQKESSHIARNI